MTATTVETRNFWLDALAGHWDYSYAYETLTYFAMNAMLTHGGVPGEPGAYALQNTFDIDFDQDAYADAADGATKTYLGSPVAFPLIEADMADATHLILYWDDAGGTVFGWVFEFGAPIEMLAGRAITVTMPDIVFDPDGVTAVGPSGELRMRLFNNLFLEATSPMSAGEYLDLALYVGDPLAGGVEVDAWDYQPIRVQTGISFSGLDPHILYYRPSETKRWPRCWTDWGTITHWGWKDVAATPTLRMSAPFDTPINAVAGTLIEVEPDALAMTFGDLV